MTTSPGLESLLSPYAAALHPLSAQTASDPMAALFDAPARGLDQLVTGAGAPGGHTGGVVGLGQQLAGARFGWTGPQWDALYKLWQRESGWNPNADNPTSSAFGIPQMMTSVHNVSDRYMSGDPRTQILAGLRYIHGRYGDPASAWQHSQQSGWY